MDTAYRIPPVSAMDITGTQRWLEEMAARGLHLEKYLWMLCVFHRGQPVQARYRIEPQHRRLRQPCIQPDKEELYEDMGWQFVGPINNELQIFRSTDPGAPEPHADPQLLSGAYGQMLRRHKHSYWLLIPILVVLGILNLTSMLPLDLAAPDLLSDVFYVALMVPFQVLTVVAALWTYRIWARLQHDLSLGISPQALSLPRELNKLELASRFLFLLLYALLLLQIVMAIRTPLDILWVGIAFTAIYQILFNTGRRSYEG